MRIDRVAAVNADGTFGVWRYALARKIDQVRLMPDRSGLSPDSPAPGTSADAGEGSSRAD